MSRKSLQRDSIFSLDTTVAFVAILDVEIGINALVEDDDADENEISGQDPNVQGDEVEQPDTQNEGSTPIICRRRHVRN